jgi:hypothetical protein
MWEVRSCKLFDLKVVHEEGRQARLNMAKLLILLTNNKLVLNKSS